METVGWSDQEEFWGVLSPWLSRLVGWSQPAPHPVQLCSETPSPVMLRDAQTHTYTYLHMCSQHRPMQATEVQFTRTVGYDGTYNFTDVTRLPVSMSTHIHTMSHTQTQSPLALPHIHCVHRGSGLRLSTVTMCLTPLTPPVSPLGIPAPSPP
jgi:hypothetical protein